MHKKHTGIVVKRYFPQKQKIVLFDDEWGKITCVPPHDRISLGTLLSYETQVRNGVMFIYDVELIAMPFDGLEIDILFVHHVLEVCYYFIPIGSAEFQIYPFLINIMRSFDDISSVRIQKGLICKILAHLGVYPINSHLALPLEDFINIPIDNVVMGNLELAHEDFFDRWLTWCLTTHPQGKKCKALTLLLQK